MILSYKVKSLYVTIRNFLFGKPVFKQELLLRQALIEKEIDINKLKINCDHINGVNYVNGIKLNIKYPESFLEKAKVLVPENKTINFYFNGNMDDSGQRSSLLKPFMDRKDSAVIRSNDGRIQDRKDQFNEFYYSGLAQAKFGLCPHQLNWPGDKNNLWTYRFIECCFTSTIPILFRMTPLGQEFVKDFKFFWDDFILVENLDLVEKSLIRHTQHNVELAKQRFCLSDEEILRIKETIN